MMTSLSFPERMEKHEEKTWHDLSFNHKTTSTMGLLTPLACKEVYPGEFVKLMNEIRLKFAALYLPIMHQCYFTLDWFYVTYDQLWPKVGTSDGWQNYIKEDPNNPSVEWAWTKYYTADAVFTSGLLNYLGFNAPPGAGTLIAATNVGAMPIAAYLKIYDEYFRNDQIQSPLFTPLVGGNNETALLAALPDFKCLRRNWPRDYYTSATPTPQQGANVLIPTLHQDPVTGDFTQTKVFRTDGTTPGNQNLYTLAGMLVGAGDSTPFALQLGATMEDFRYAARELEFLERAMRAGDRYPDFVERNFAWNPNPLYIDRPVWIGGYTGDVVISDVFSTTQNDDIDLGQYAGRAVGRDNTPQFTYQCPDYGFVYCLFTCYPKASYYSGLEKMWVRNTKMEYMWEQFANIGDQPVKNKEVWFSWYDADIDWNNEIFGYLPIYSDHRYSNDIVSGQMRTLWEAFHLGRKFTAASQVVLNSDFIKCTPDIGRVFVVDAEAGEHEIYIHAWNDIQILRRLPRLGLPQL